MRTIRYDAAQDRFVLNIAKNDPALFTVKRLEGRRWDKQVRVWTTPPTLRAYRKLTELGFTMLEYGGGRDYITWLEEGCPSPRRFDPTLFGFQQDGVSRLLMKPRMRLDDEPGLGKTHQAIVWGQAQHHPKLVLAPKVLLPVWGEALKERGEQAIAMREPDFHTAKWLIVNPEYLQNLRLEETPFDLIVDEAHLYTNTKARRTKHALALAEKATRVLLLTGTPPAQPVRVWPHMMMLGIRNAKEFFPYALRYTGAEHNGYGWDFSGATHLDELREELQPYTLRRTKAEVLPDLPEKLHTTILAEAGRTTTRQLSALDAEISTLVDKGHALGGVGVGVVQRLRVLSSSAKVATTASYVAGSLPSQLLVFCEFRETMDQLEAAIQDEAAQLQDQHCVVRQLHGDVGDRESLVEEFQDGRIQVLLIQYNVGALGLTLTASSTVVIHDLPWTPEQLDQAIDRVHRIGQRNSVHIVTILSESRVEGRMLAGLRAGRQLTEALYPSAF